jgi:hypothetical protein
MVVSRSKLFSRSAERTFKELDINTSLVIQVLQRSLYEVRSDHT